MRIKKSLSIQEDVLKKAEARAKEMFADNFSMYITFLINQDTKGIKMISEDNEIESTEAEKAIDKESTNSLDDILNIGE